MILLTIKIWINFRCDFLRNPILMIIATFIYNEQKFVIFQFLQATAIYWHIFMQIIRLVVSALLLLLKPTLIEFYYFSFFLLNKFLMGMEYLIDTLKALKSKKSYLKNRRVWSFILILNIGTLDWNFKYHKNMFLRSNDFMVNLKLKFIIFVSKY